MTSPEGPGQEGARWLTASLGLWAVGVLTLEPLAAAGMAGTVLWVGARVLWPGRDRWREAARDWRPVLLFIGWALLIPTFSGHPPTGTGVARTLDWQALPFAAVAWARLDAGGRRKVLVATGVTFGLSCLAAGLQHLGAWPGPQAFEPFRFTRIPFHRVYEPYPGADGRFMGGGLAFHRLKFADVGALAALALLCAGLAGRGARRAWLLGAAAVGAVALAVFPNARAAAGSLLVACAVPVIWMSRRRVRALALAGAVGLLGAAAVAAVPPLRQEVVERVTARSGGHRAVLLQAGVDASLSHPLAGIGRGRFRVLEHVPKDAPASARAHTGKAHNQYVSLAAEVGIPGALLFLWMLVWLGRRATRTPEGALAVSALCFFGLLSLLHDPLFHAPFSMALVLALGAGVSGHAQAARTARS